MVNAPVTAGPTSDQGEEMVADVDTGRVRAVLDLAIARLFEDAMLLETAGFPEEAEDSHACAVALKVTRAQVLRFRSEENRQI